MLEAPQTVVVSKSASIAAEHRHSLLPKYCRTETHVKWLPVLGRERENCEVETKLNFNSTFESTES